MTKTWRDRAAPIIAQVINEYGLDNPKLKKALFDAYPFGERKWWPYKIWLSEIAYQTGKKKRPIPGQRKGQDSNVLRSKGQLDLIKGETNERKDS